MRPRNFLFLACGLLTLAAFSSWPLSRAADRSGADFTVHEWGTFTSITGSEGKAIKWSPLNAADDLPGFVEHFVDNRFKASLVGTVRMETPVLYFYARQKMNLSVKVGFSKGLLTEWYPHANEVTPTLLNRGPMTELFDQNFAAGTISWNSITLDPSLAPTFPREPTPSRYYAARATSATPLRVETVNGDEAEKFLFYRGVSAFTVPIAATIATDGKIVVRDLTAQPAPEVILFERRGDKVGYRTDAGMENTATLDQPKLTANVDSLEKEIRTMLVRQGLYVDEARAMVATWHDSWFEEGSRLIYAVPAPYVDSILPLNINPAPARTVRVFVGRMELITPATRRAVETALRARDDSSVAGYGRFLYPIFEDIMQSMDKSHHDAMSNLFSSYISRQQKRALVPTIDRRETATHNSHRSLER